MELNREDMVKMLKNYLIKLNREYELPTGGTKHLAENIIDGGEQDTSKIPITPCRSFAVSENGFDPDTGLKMTANTTVFFTHIDSKEKKLISLN